MTSITEQKLFGLTFDSIIMNGSGPSGKTYEHLCAIQDSSSAAIVTKSMTLNPKKGNPKTNEIYTDHYSINSIGFENDGFNFFKEFSSQYWNKTKPLVFSLAGIVDAETMKMVYTICTNKLSSLIEVNLSCPNVDYGTDIYDFDQLKSRIRWVESVRDRVVPVGIKLPPYFTKNQWDKIATILNESTIDFVTLSNSLPNAMILDSTKGSFLLTSEQSKGGMGGPAMFPICLSNTFELRKRLRKSIKIISIGGVNSAQDALDLVRCGANLVQVTTYLGNNSPTVVRDMINKINTDLNLLLQSLKYSQFTDYYCSVLDHSGKLILQ
ncbi:MAG: hypothetical protein ACRCXZ_10390 [Patescibacteria group bacterium]